MSFVTARPAALAGAAGRADGVSASTATQFSEQSMTVHELFTAALRARAGSYAATEAASTIVAS